MDHQEALETLAIEKYLLDEFSPERRDEFEEHYFFCGECAQGVQAGAALLEHGKRVVQEEASRSAARRPVSIPAERGWFAWLRPAFALPAMAMLLGVVVFQNLVQFPSMQRSLTAMNSPAVLPSAYLAGGSVRGDGHVVAAKPGEIFQLTIDIPDTGNTAHIAELYDAAGRKKWSLDVPENSPKEGLSIRMPGDLPAGSYALVVKRANSSGTDELARYAFTLQRQ
jgi:hypothetical protein